MFKKLFLWTLIFFYVKLVHCEDPVSSDDKIAFLFLTKGPMPLEDIWREFFHWRANSSHYTIYVHPHGGYKYPPTSFFHGKDIPEKVNVRWGGMSQVRAIKYLVRAALQDPLNKWFTLMSETCIPLIPFEKWRKILLANTKSVINACAMDPSEMETETRWRPSLDAVGMKKSDWRKSATWFALTRKHAEVFANETALESGWESVPCCDEHYLPSILAYNHLDNETTCTDGFAHVNWPSLIASHPRQYNGDEINADLFAYFERPVSGHAGFGQQCTGYKEICHFTARKFAANTKHALLENLDLILSDDDHPYMGNPWDHHQDKVRYDAANGKYYLIEAGMLRAVPDNYTFEALHIKFTREVQKLNEGDKLMYPMGEPFPPRNDGILLKARKTNGVYMMRDGKKHHIPTYPTFLALGLNADDIIELSATDFEEIPLGQPLPAVHEVTRT